MDKTGYWDGRRKARIIAGISGKIDREYAVMRENKGSKGEKGERSEDIIETS